MKNKSLISFLACCIAVLSGVATTAGIFTQEGAGAYEHTSIRGQKVIIYGKGLYQHMSAEVAPQGIAQDVVTLGIGIPLLLLSLLLFRKGKLIGKYLLTGTLGYFLVTYLFYTVMGMYNQLFLVYVLLLSCSFFAFLLSLFSLLETSNGRYMPQNAATKLGGGYLIFAAVCIALLWLSIVVPPLLKNIIPVEVEHYTTLIVQGLDLAILLPAAVLSGVLLLQKKPLGYVLAPVYLVFLSILMTALTAKVIAMALAGYNIIPAVFMIPVFNVAAVVSASLLLKSITSLDKEIVKFIQRVEREEVVN